MAFSDASYGPQRSTLVKSSRNNLPFAYQLVFRHTFFVTSPLTPNASYSVTLRVKIHNKPGKLGEVTTAIGKAGGDIEGIDIVSVGKDFLIRDITVNAASETHDKQIIESVSDIDG